MMIIEYSLSLNKEEEKKSYVANIKDSNCSIGLLINRINDECNEILEKSIKIPTFFVDFPLIGSEKFNFPFYINSHYFYPNEPRSWIVLKKESKAKYNKELFESSLKLIIELFQYAIEKNWKNCHYLASNSIPMNVDEEWFINSILKPYRKIILSSKIVENEFGELIELKESIFPFDKNQELIFKLRKLLFPFFKERIVKNDKNYIDFWYKVLSDEKWENSNGNELNYSISDLLKKLSKLNNLKNLMQSISLNDNEALKLINKILKFISNKYDNFQKNIFFSENSFIPNQLENFYKKEDLKEDDQIPKEIKDIMFYELNQNIRSCLLHTKINPKFLHLEKKVKIDDVGEKINDLISENYYDKKSNTHKFKAKNWNAIYRLLSLIPVKNDNSMNQSFWKFALSYSKFVSSQSTFIENKSVNFWIVAQKTLLCHIYEQLENTNSLKDMISNMNSNYITCDNELIEWLNKFYEFYKNINKNNSEFFPNQKGKFCLIENLKFDQTEKLNKEDENKNVHSLNSFFLKNIHDKLLNVEIANSFLHNGIKSEYVPSILPIMNKRDLTLKIDNFVKKNFESVIKNNNCEIIDLFQHYELIKDESKRCFFLPNFHNERTEIMMKIFLDDEKKNEMCSLIRAKNLNVLVKAVEFGIEEKDLEILEKIKKFPELFEKNFYKTVQEIEKNSLITESNKLEMLVNNCISNEEQFLFLFENSKTIPTLEDYLYIKRLIERSINNVKNLIMNNENYNLDYWKVDINSKNLNIIHGVKKLGNDIIIVIRPTDRGYVKFHDELEIESLKHHNCEFWGDNGQKTRIITLGSIIEDNELNKFKVF